MHLQSLINPDPFPEQAHFRAGMLPADHRLPEPLRSPPALRFLRHRRWQKALALADALPHQVRTVEVVGVPVWCCDTEDGEDPECVLQLLLVSTDGTWWRLVPLEAAQAVWFTGRITVGGRRLIVPSRMYAPSVEMDGRFGEYAVRFFELTWDLATGAVAAPVTAAPAPSDPQPSWSSRTLLAMPEAALPPRLRAVVEERIRRLQIPAA